MAFYKQIRRDQDDDNDDDEDNDSDADAFWKAEPNNALTTKTGIPGGRGRREGGKEGGWRSVSQRLRFGDGKTRLETALSVGLTE